MSTKELIIASIQEQMEQAVECVEEAQYGAAQIHFRECGELCQQLEIEWQLAKTPREITPLMIDLKP